MTCRELIEFLADYIDGAVHQRSREVFEQHLAACADCRRYLDSYRRTIDAAKDAYDADCDAPPHDMPPALVEAILSARRRA